MRSRSVYLAVAAAFCLTLWSSTAHADLEDPVHNGIKGAVGLGLIGAELPLIIEGAFGVRNPWLLSIIPIVVSAGGAVGGYYMGRASPEASVATLVLGIALIIPAALLVAYGRSYRSSRDEDEGFTDRTEEGQADEDEPTRSEDGTETEVIGPEEGGGDSYEPSDGEDDSDESSDAGGQNSLDERQLASVRLDGMLPVGGLLRLVADEREATLGVQLTLSTFQN